MKQEQDILDKIGKDSGFRVPEGYFADFTKKMTESLPEKTFKKQYILAHIMVLLTEMVLLSP